MTSCHIPVTFTNCTNILFCIPGWIKQSFKPQDEFIRRAGTPDAKDNKTLVKEYYRKLRVDLQTEVDAIANEIGELSKEK